MEKLPKSVAGPDCGEVALDHMLDEDAGRGVAELACGEREDGDAFFSCSCRESVQCKIADYLLLLIVVRYSTSRLHKIVNGAGRPGASGKNLRKRSDSNTAMNHSPTTTLHQATHTPTLQPTPRAHLSHPASCVGSAGAREQPVLKNITNIYL